MVPWENKLAKGRLMQRAKHIVVFLAVAASVIGACVFYAHFTSERIFRESAGHLQEIYTQIDRTFTSLATDAWMRLDTWDTVSRGVSQNAPDANAAEAAIVRFLEDEQGKWGFTSFYFLDGERYLSPDGAQGTFETAGQLTPLYEQGERVVADTRPAESGAPTLFAIPVPEGSFRGFSYRAIAVAYDARDLASALDVGVFDDTSVSTIAYPDGQSVFSTSPAAEYQANLLSYLEKNAQFEVGGDLAGIRADIAAGNAGCASFRANGERFYLVYRPVGVQDWTLLGTVPADKVNANADAIQQATVVIVALVLAAFGGALIAAIGAANRRSLDAKYAEHLRQALDLAKSANEAKSRFLANMSHDIRTPINAVIGMARIAQENPDDAEKVRECLRTIDSSSKHLLGLINDVLDVSKIESGEINLQESSCCIDDTVESVLAIIGPQASEKGLSLSVDTRDIVHRRFAADELRGRQIMLNLLSNAVKYTPRGGTVEFTVREVPAANPHFARLRIVVADSGIGMSPEFADRLFQPFARDERVAARNIAGTGLGMTITKAIVDAMGGTIEVESEVGRGTTFAVELELPTEEPLAPAGGAQAFASAAGCESPGQTAMQEDSTREGAPAAPVPAARAGDLSRAFSGKRFLIAEDSIINQRILTEFIKARGGAVEIACDGQQAVRSFSENPPGTFDAVFMDVMMPVMDGFAATRAIRGLSREDARSVVILAVTANAYAEDVKAAHDAGMDAHIAKPYDIDDIARTLLSLHKDAPASAGAESNENAVDTKKEGC